MKLHSKLAAGSGCVTFMIGVLMLRAPLMSLIASCVYVHI
jgi:uncharacterized membrane protein HdeD (DUF308 family)